MENFDTLSKSDFGGGKDPRIPLRLFRRFSSVKVNYEKERRKTISKYQQQGLQISNIAIPKLFEDKREIRKRLRASVERYSFPELYVKIICALFPQLKSREAPDSNALINHLKRVFRLNDIEHAQLMDIARMTKLPQRIINLEIVEARDIPAKDPNGLSDPFCVVFVNSRELAQRTKVVPTSLNPVWKEYFTFKINDPSRDILHVEVMDYNEQDEPLRDRIRRFKELKSPGTLGILLKEIANARSAQELIGSLRIPASEISSETIEKWFKLKNNENRGEIYLRMALGYNKSKEAASEEFLQIVHFLVVYELDRESSLGTPFYWDEHYEMWSKYILRQFKWQGGLKPKDIVLSKWRAYTAINSIFPLNANMMCLLMDAVMERALNCEYDTRESTRLWDCTVLLIDSILRFMTDIHDVLPCPVTVLHTYHMLKTLELLNQVLDEPPKCDRGTIPFTKVGIYDRVAKAVRDGANKFYVKVFSDSTYEQIRSDEDPLYLALQRLLKMGQILHEDLRLGLSTVQTDFKGILNIDYATITFAVYDEQFGKMVKYIVEEYNGNLMDTNDESSTENDDDLDEESPSVKIALVVLQLYLAVKNLADLAPLNYLDENGSPEFSLKRNYHDWFFHSVANWIDTLRRKIMKWVRNSINFSEARDLDDQEESYKLNKIEDQTMKDVPCSPSAIDTAQMFHEINKFWIALGWQNPHQSYVIVRKLLEELYGYLIYYAAQLLEVVKSRKPPMEKRNDDVVINAYLKKACREINNINYVKEQVEVLAQQLNISSIIEKITLTDANFFKEKSDEYEQSIDSITGYMQEQIGTVTDSIIKNCLRIVSPKFRLLLEEMFKDEQQNSTNFLSYITTTTTTSQRSSVQCKQFISYIDNCLIIMNENLEKQNFRQMLGKFWEETVHQVSEMVDTGLETGKTAEYFEQFGYLITDLHSLFWPSELDFLDGDKNCQDWSIPDTYEALQNKLAYLQLTFENLKIKYYECRHKRQESTAIKGNEHGSITVRTCYLNKKEEVVVEILNARNLKSYDSNNLSDPYAVVTLVPSECFPTAPRLTTKVHKETLFPLFEETFTFKMMDKERATGFLLITLQDRNFFGKDEIMGEVFVSLANITVLEDESGMLKLPQAFMSLCKPDESDLEWVKRFEQRLWDKKAVQFGQQERGKMHTNN